MSEIVFATCLDAPGYYPDDRVLAEALGARGAAVSPAPWNGPFAPFERADLVVVRSTWDYTKHYGAFLDWLGALEAAAVPVLNAIPLMRWNTDKRYLLELQDKGAPVQPCIACPADVQQARDAALERGWTQVVLKPFVAAGGDGVRLVAPEDREAFGKAVHEAEPGLMQAFAPEIRTHGETSLVFFEGEYSHAAVKTPAAGEILCQHEHGGTVARAEPPDWAIDEAGAVLRLAPGEAFYARIDAVITDEAFSLMELEVCEPELFFALTSDIGAIAADRVLRRTRTAA